MKFPNAYSGVKKLFTARLLSFIGAACLVIAVILIAIPALQLLRAAAEESVDSIGAGAVVSGVGGIIFGVAGLVIPIVAYILTLIGLKVASRDEESFGMAFRMTIFVLIISVINAIFTVIWANYGIVDNITGTLLELCEIFIAVFVISGVATLAEKLGRQDIVGLGSRMLILLIVINIIVALARLIPVFFGVNTPAGASMENILSIVAAAGSLVYEIVFLIYLGKAKKMLGEAKA